MGCIKGKKTESPKCRKQPRIKVKEHQNSCHKAHALYFTSEAILHYSVSFPRSLHFDWLDPLKSFTLTDWNLYYEKLPSLLFSLFKMSNLIDRIILKHLKHTIFTLSEMPSLILNPSCYSLSFFSNRWTP